MKKFQFSLEKVKEVKEIEEKVIMREFSVAQKDLLVANQKKENLDDEVKVQWEKRNNLNIGAVSRIEIMNIINYVNSLQNDINQINIEINSLEDKLDRIRKRLLSKAQERQTLEKIREIKFAEYKKNIKKQEQLFLDEISSRSAFKEI